MRSWKRSPEVRAGTGDREWGTEGLTWLGALGRQRGFKQKSD